jgi:hypothetical protein
MSVHAKNRPPSAAKRWLACPFSATVAPLYPEDPSKQSLKGDLWHELMEVLVTYGTLPLDADPDACDALQDLYDYVLIRVKEGGPETKVYVEQVLEIPSTGEIGTADIIIVAPAFLEVIDEKSGYIAVDVQGNAQELLYLTGVVAKHGTRDQYRLTIHQPNYDHVDGTLRHWEPTYADLEAMSEAVAESIRVPDKVQAGPHCKATYCDHRGACEAFREYAMNDLSLGWHSSELKSMDDLKLSQALDASDELGGWRNELRAEAMRRIMNMDRQIEGYKIVKGRKQRTIVDARGLVSSVLDVLGPEWAHKLFPELAWVRDIPYDRDEALKSLGTPKTVEDVIKQYARVNKAQRGEWKKLYDTVAAPYIRETSSTLTLERAIDGRPAHKRGSEFGVIDHASTPTGSTTL